MREKVWMFSILFGLVCAAVVGTSAIDGGTEAEARSVETLVYFLRHGDDEVSLIDNGDGTFTEDCVPFLKKGVPDECCLEVLNSLGELRATLLAKWFRDQGITEQLTHVIASHKTRTRQTVQQIALDAALGGDIDQHPGDGVQQIPPFVEECDDGFEGASSSRDPMIAVLAVLPAGSQIVVGAHSGTIYKIMDAFGIDTSDPVDFPRKPNGKVKGFNNLWIVSIDDDGEARLEEHIVLDFELVEQDDEDDDDDD